MKMSRLTNIYMQFQLSRMMNQWLWPTIPMLHTMLSPLVHRSSYSTSCTRLMSVIEDHPVTSNNGEDKENYNKSTVEAQPLIDKYLGQGHYPTENEKKVIQERQLVHKVSRMFAVSPPCRHGYPQAFVQFPMAEKMSSGMIRLSCPHLVKAIDDLENTDNGIKNINQILNSEEGEDYRANYRITNSVWKQLRNEAVTKEEREEILLREGVTKVDDVKCLHAHVADHLMRGDNKVGQWTLEQLGDQGIERSGCSDCWQQCDRNFTRIKDSWWYMPKKNKQGLKAAKIRRNSQKKSQRENVETSFE